MKSCSVLFRTSMLMLLISYQVCTVWIQELTNLQPPIIAPSHGPSYDLVQTIVHQSCAVLSHQKPLFFTLCFVRFPSNRNEKLFCFVSHINADVVDILPSLYGLSTRIDPTTVVQHHPQGRFWAPGKQAILPLVFCSFSIKP